MLKLKRTKLVIAGLALAATVAVAFLAVRVNLRLYALYKVLRLPEARVRLVIKPQRRTLTANPAPTHPINLGYAAFDTGSTNALFIESTASGAAVVLTNRDVYMAFLPPFAPEKPMHSALTSISAREARTHPHTLGRMQEWEADEMSAEMAWEETQPLPIFRILFMSSDDFLLYSLKVAFKAGNRNGSKEVQFVRTPDLRAIVRVGQATNDSRNAAVFLSSLDGTRNVGLRLWITTSSAFKISDYLDPVLRSFRFTVDRVDDREAMKALIRGAGIQQRKLPPTDE